MRNSVARPEKMLNASSHQVASARTDLLSLCISAFLNMAGLSDPVLGSGFKKPSANAYMRTVAAASNPLQPPLGNKVPY